MKRLILIGSLVFVASFKSVAESNAHPTQATFKATNSFCKTIKKKLHKVVSKGTNPDHPNFELDKYYLWPDQNENGVNTFNIDVDRDGEPDALNLSCSNSIALPSDPCLLTTTLSATGKQFYFSAWNIRLMKIESKLYVLAHHNDKARYELFTESTKKDEGYIYHPEVAASIKYQLYKLSSTGLTHTCRNI